MMRFAAQQTFLVAECTECRERELGGQRLTGYLAVLSVR